MAESAGAGMPPPTVADLRRWWDSGRRRDAIRGVLDRWEDLPGEPGGLGWLQGALRQSGLEAEAFQLQAVSARRRGGDADWESLVASVRRFGDPWWARELIAEAGERTRALRAQRIEVELEIGGDASALLPEWIAAYRDEAALDAAVHGYVRSARVDEAERLLDRVPGAPLWRARLSLWRNRPEAALAFIEGLAASPEVSCIEAIAAVQQGRAADAEALLRPLLAGEMRGEAGSWLAMVLRKQGRYREAAEAADVSSFASPTFNLAARLERELAGHYERGTAREAQAIPYFEHAEVLYGLGLTPTDPLTSVEALIDRLGGNHTPHVTLADGGDLRSHRIPLDPRFLGANVLRVLRTRGPEAARALYRELAPSVDGHPLFRIYEGELELWMGEYEAAARIFREALAPNERVLWAWIGLGASAMLQGDLREAQEIWEKGLRVMGFAGPTLYVYRGECYRRQGEVELARRELETAVRNSPQRLSAWINLALLDGGAEVLERAERQCAAFAPILMQELEGTVDERLEQVLRAMRGNRRSSPMHITYHLWDRLWHGATPS